MRDEIGRDAISGIRAVVKCQRKVRKGYVSINGDFYRGPVLDSREGETLIFTVKDLYASEYNAYDNDWRPLGGIVKGDRWVRECDRHRKA